MTRRSVFGSLGAFLGSMSIPWQKKPKGDPGNQFTHGYMEMACYHGKLRQVIL